MATPVWVLSVDLQTKTATFQSGMAEAAKSARSAFQDIGSSAKTGGDAVTGSTTNVRAALGLLDNTIRGNHAAAMADLVREFQNTQAVMALLPFAAVIGGIAAVAGIAVEVASKIKEWREESQRLTDEETKFGTAVNEAFNGLDRQILQAQVRADELRNDHLAKVRDELALIDKESMGDLVKQLDTISKAADAVFANLQGHWYTFGIGSAGAKHALDEFKVQYDSLISQGKEKEAGDLLKGTRENAEKSLAALKTVNSGNMGGTGSDEQWAQAEKYHAALNAIHADGLSGTRKELEAQEQLVKALDAQVTATQKVEELKKLQSGNVKTADGNEQAGRAAEAQRAAIESRLRMGESELQAAKAQEDAKLEITRAGLGLRLVEDIQFAAKERDLQLSANREETAALNKTAADYANQVRAMHEKASEIESQYASKVTELRARAAVEQAKKDEQDFEASERGKVQATQEGSQQRLAALTAAEKAAEALGLQDTAFYKELETQKVETARKAAEETAKLAAEAGKEAAANSQKVAELAMAADQERQAVLNSAHRLTLEQQIQQQVQQSNQELAIKKAAIEAEQAALDTGDKQYQNKLKALQDQELQLIRQHENQVTQIRDQAEIQRNQKILAAEQTLQNSIAQGLTQTLMGHQSFARTMDQIGNQVVSGLMETAIKSVIADDYSKERDAAAAARKAYLAGMQFPWPTNIVMGPTLGALAFASVMAFSNGTDAVPGVGNKDTTPAMLTPGEGVVPGGVMDGLRSVAKNGGFQQKAPAMLHAPFSPNVMAMDAKGVDKVLTKQHKVFQRHLDNAIRKMNKS